MICAGRITPARRRLIDAGHNFGEPNVEGGELGVETLEQLVRERFRSMRWDGDGRRAGRPGNPADRVEVLLPSHGPPNTSRPLRTHGALGDTILIGFERRSGREARALPTAMLFCDPRAQQLVDPGVGVGRPLRDSTFPDGAQPGSEYRPAFTQLYAPKERRCEEFPRNDRRDVTQGRRGGKGGDGARLVGAKALPPGRGGQRLDMAWPRPMRNDGEAPRGHGAAIRAAQPKQDAPLGGIRVVGEDLSALAAAIARRGRHDAAATQI